MVRASQEYSAGGQVTNVYNFGFGARYGIDMWCTTDSDPDPYVELELTSPVLITKILLSGRNNSLGSYFVTNFTIEYSPPNNTTALSYYTTDTGNIKVSSVRLILNTIMTATLNFIAVFLQTPLEHLTATDATSFDKAPTFQAAGVV